ncbi:TadE/TadG family type IV pilus assembly protein [Aurantiacibacter sp. MUD61]|uniref:TadE/TadG family type IV pilus assembly protein n=1 Tax=Aurantiacibacter sp. MUD61 TaxID=3009083 RepID=UPI0022F09CD2|nr:TadE/TadG family type IV pilus assembly protein [Aurantiacibacter sp. MUD61]
MITKIRRNIARMAGCSSGNATLLVALGMPVLIGGAGLGVDMTQWYMWKRELQFAVDQSAVAGAWAMADEDTASTYSARALQEFNANLSVTDDFNEAPSIRLADYAGGNLNSVAVSATANKTLPFTSFLTGGSTTIYAYAQASFEEGATFTSCLVALDEEDTGAITIGGNSVLTASCGLAALSTADEAISVNGNPTVAAGWILAAGGVDDWLKENTDDIIMENMEGLYDPFEELEPPAPDETLVERTYSCSAEPDTTTADVTRVTVTEYDYYQGSNERNATGWANGEGKEDSRVTSFDEGIRVPNGTEAGTTESSSVQWTSLGGSGSSRKWERKTTTVYTTHDNVVVEEGAQAGSVRPGTYSDLQISCNTAFAPGVYHLRGGGLKIPGQYEVTGSAVMFVLYDGAYIDITGGADVNLTAMQASDLMAVGVPADDANDLAGMLVFEDRSSPGSNKTKFNGNANTVLNGALYFPTTNVQFAGTIGVTSQCLMIAASNITITGTTNMSTFCPADSSEDTTVVTTAAKVRLVA